MPVSIQFLLDPKASPAAGSRMSMRGVRCLSRFCPLEIRPRLLAGGVGVVSVRIELKTVTALPRRQALGAVLFRSYLLLATGLRGVIRIVSGTLFELCSVHISC
jgi:hypothetical protein